MRSVKEKAYAKINLHLDVLAKREDGFHDIRTVMHTVSLCDEVTVSIADSGRHNIRMIVDGGKWIPTDSKNLCYVAAEKFIASTGISADVTIKLKKRIPVSAGLAGGSADAAAVLRALNRVFDRPLTDKRLLNIAAGIGSDVPFCLLGGTALCEGRGEIMTRLPDGLSLNVVIASSGEHVSTPVAYSLIDKMYFDFDGSIKAEGEAHLSQLLDSIKKKKLNCSLFNLFEAAILPTCPGAEQLKNMLISLGATHAMMSGSGPSVYGVFADYADAERAAEEINSAGYTAYVATSIN